MGLLKGPRQVSGPLLSARLQRGAHFAVDHFQIRRKLLFLLADRRAIGKSTGRSGGRGSLPTPDHLTRNIGVKRQRVRVGTVLMDYSLRRDVHCWETPDKLSTPLTYTSLAYKSTS
jgi:hypothetical protein